MTMHPGSTLSTLELIALVDDNEYDNEFNSIVLAKAGFTGNVIVYLSGEAALDALRDSDTGIDLLFLDINMPGMSGFEFASALSGPAWSPALPAVVMLTSSPDPWDIRQATSYRVVRAVVTKPLTPASVVDVVAQVAATFAAASSASSASSASA